MVSKKDYEDALLIIDMYEKQEKKKEFLSTLFIDTDEVLEYRDLAGFWYEYTKDLQENPFFEPIKIRIRKK
jgi:hypothetical protein